MAYSADVWKDGSCIGLVRLSDEDARHFLYAPRCVARVALSQPERDDMQLDSEDEITLNVRKE